MEERSGVLAENLIGKRFKDIPQSEQRKDQFLQAPDLRPQEGTSALDSWMSRYESDNQGFVGWLKKMVSSLVRDD